MQNLNLGAFADKLESRVGKMAVANIYDYDIISDGIARVICGFNRKVAPAEARAALAYAFNDQISVIDYSFRMIPGAKEYRPIMAGYIQSNRIVRDFEESSTNYKVMATNILMDKVDESLWQLSTSPSGAKYLTRQDNEDISELLSMAKVRDISIPTLASVASDVKDSEYVCYIDAATASVEFGYAMNAGLYSTASILHHGTNKIVDVLKDFIVEVANLNGTDRVRAVASTTEDLVSYYKEMYNYDPGYYAQLEEIIKDRASA